jgi:adenylate cyclase
MARRLTAILAADVVGYSRLMGSDEAGTLAAFKSVRADLIDGKIAEHEGRMVKLTGDGLLVEFPSVVSAVACAAAIQRGMRERNADVPQDRRIEFRIGVNLGDVIVEGDDIFGDGVNVAARLEGVAQPGGIAVSQAVRDHVGNRLNLTFEDRGEQELKNIEKPVRVYDVLLEDNESESAMSMGEKEKPSIAVLPFTNMSGDPEQEYFSDGITEDIITDLSKVSGLSVIARHSAFSYKGKALKVQQIGRELGVDFVVEGSVRKAGTRVRVTGQLVNCKDAQSSLGRAFRSRPDRHLCHSGRNHPRHSRSIKGKAVTAGEEIDRSNPDGKHRSLHLLPARPQIRPPIIKAQPANRSPDVRTCGGTRPTICSRLRWTGRLRFTSAHDLPGGCAD